MLRFSHSVFRDRFSVGIEYLHSG